MTRIEKLIMDVSELNEFYHKIRKMKLDNNAGEFDRKTAQKKNYKRFPESRK